MTTKPHLHHIDLGSNSRDTLAALIKLLTPHVPYSLSVLGTILNAGPRTHTLQDGNVSQVSLWSTIPLRSESTDSSDPPALFSIVVFCHPSRQFSFFCSAESSTSTDSPTEMEEAHVEHVFLLLRRMARKERPLYDSVLIASRHTPPTARIDSDPPMIIVGGVHGRWKRCLEKASECQNPTIRYPLPPKFRVMDEGRGQGETDTWVVSQIRQSDIPFVRGGSSIPRSQEYIMSRAPYSVCLRSKGQGGDDAGMPVACAFIHSDGSIGSLHVDPEHQRKGLGKLVISLLAESLDFKKGRSEPSSAFDDLGGGALGWNWTDTSEQNEVAHRFFTSLADEENKWMCHWTYMFVDQAEDI